MSKTFVLLFILCFHRLLAQTSSEFTLLSTDQGLSQGMVFDILQDRNGFLWVATKNGLNRYDGYHFQIYTHDPFDQFSLASSEIRKLFEDSRGRIWICHSEGLDIFVPQNGLFFHLKPYGPTGFDEDQDYRSPRFAELPDGTVWAVDSSKIWKFEVLEGVLEKAAAAGNAFPDLPCRIIETPRQAGQPLEVTSILLSQNRTLLVGTSQGFYRLNPASGQMTLEGLPDARVFIIGEARGGQIWLEGVWYDTMGSVTVYSKYVLISWLNGVQQGYPVGVVPSGFAYQRPVFQLDEAGFLWRLGGNKLVKAPPSVLAAGGTPEVEWTFADALARNPYFYLPAFVVDRSGIVWLGTSGFGVIKVNLTKPKFSSYLPYTTQRQIFEDPQGRLFTSMNESRLYLSEKFDRYGANFWLHDIPIWGNYSIVFDTAGCSWYNRGDGILHRFDVRTRQHRSFLWQGFGLVRTKGGKLYSAGETGLQEFNPRTEKSAFYPFDQPQKSPGFSIYSYYLYEGADNTLWIFGFEGLIRASAKAGDFQFSYFKNNPDAPNTLSNNSVLCVLDDPLEPARFLWVGTKGGLNRLDKQTGDFKHYKTAQGLPDDVVYGILPDDNGHIWLSTNKGLCRFQVREETTKNFTVADGLQNNEFNQSSYLKTRNGALIFGGINGLTVFHPDSLRFNEHLPQTRIIGIKVNNKSLPPGEVAVRQFAHDQNFLTLEFAALEFSNPAQNRYRYKLLRHGFFDRLKGDSWVDLGENNVVQFANLSPGSYTFRVLGSNNDGFWSQQPAEFHFEIRPPWWASWWAYLLYVGVVAGLIWWIYRYQLRQKLEHQETRRLRELDEFKSNFFTNITHEFRTPLTVILGTTEQLATGSDQWALAAERPAVKSKLSLVKRNSENLLRLINQMLDLAKLESKSLSINYVQGDVLPYMRYIAESLHSLANAQNVLLRVESPESAMVMDYDPERLLQIVYNLLSNAIKFTPSGGKIVLRVARSEELRTLPTLQITVSDTGAGIAADELPYIFDRFYQAKNLEKAKSGGTGIGLALTKELVTLLGGEISVQSEVGKGTVFTVHLPIKSNGPMVSGHPLPIEKPLKPYISPTVAALPEFQPSNSNLQTILLIEDNPDVVEYLTACLQKNYTLDFAYNGRSGIEKALEHIPDLIVSDVMMPEKDGFEVCETLKNDERTSHIPIVLLTAKAGVENRIAGLRRGADAYLAKPFHEEELLVTLANLLDGRRKLQARFAASGFTIAETSDATATRPKSTMDMEDVFILKVKNAILENLSNSNFSVDDLCRTLAMSQPQLHRKLTALTNKNATLFIRTIRLAKAKELLLEKAMNVSEVAWAVGFDDPKYFSRVFAEEFGVPPSKI
jgi:signal transduction histidine kinase/DNA-binding response OmpR family regulator/ligand-binding sensor domain-containing protein